MTLFLAVFLIGSPRAGATEAGTFEEIMDYVQELHISNPQEETLYDGAIDGLINSLHDPYTEYMKPEELKEFSNSLEGTFEGVGIELVPGDIYPGILRTIEGSPAEKAGIRAGDVLIKVDGIDIANESLSVITQKIRGPEGTRVKLSIRRDGNDEYNFELLRSSIILPTVHSELLDGGIGYIKIDTFGSSTANDFKEALTTLRKKGAEKLILDLRNDPGGYLLAAIEIAGNFMERGKVVVSIVNNDDKRQYYYTKDDMIAGGMSVAILVNNASASASEILAGALQDHGMATLIGDRTYGKGTIQTVIPLKGGGALKLTTARYHTPSDRAIDHMGLAPDIQVLTQELQLEAAKKWLNSPDKTTVTFEEGRTEAFINGSAVKLAYAPLMKAETTYLPLRFVLEALGYRVDFRPSDGSIKVTGTGTEVVFYPRDGLTLSSGKVVTGTESLFTKDGVTYLPLPALQIFNLQVEVDNGRITIEK